MDKVGLGLLLKGQLTKSVRFYYIQKLDTFYGQFIMHWYFILLSHLRVMGFNCNTKEEAVQVSV